jgi:hypothetical protein
MDEAHFTIDADRRTCWARKGTTPIVYMNGSKEAINVGGALTWHGKFHYQELSRQTKEEVLKFVKRMHKRYKNVLFIFDRATWHKNNLVVGYFKENKDTIDYMFLPTEVLPILTPLKSAGVRHVKIKRLILPIIL